MNAFRKVRWSLLVPALVGVAAVAGVALAQVSTNFDLHWSAFTGGGGKSNSTNFQVDGSVSQPIAGDSASTNARVRSGFWLGAPGAATGTPTPTPTPTGTATATPTGTGTATVTPTATPTAMGGDSYEPDDTCGAANAITTDGVAQTHTFHTAGDTDWVKFYAATNNKTYTIRIYNTGARASPVLALHPLTDCNGAPLGTGYNAFGLDITLEWDIVQGGQWYLIKVKQHDTSVAGVDTNYDISVTLDTVPPAAPSNPRCGSINQSTIGVQWDQNVERDVVRYLVSYSNPAQSGVREVNGQDITYVELSPLYATGTSYSIKVAAQDFSGNVSTLSPPDPFSLGCVPQQPPDTTRPTVTLQQPTAGMTFTTTLSTLSFSGVAQDTGGNLSRVKVSNTSHPADRWDFSLAGSSDAFLVTDVPLWQGDNVIQVTAYDGSNNSTLTPTTITVNRVVQSMGAVIILGGHNEGHDLQTNIDNLTNRAYRIFQGAGFNDDRIYYLSETAQDADGNGTNDVDAFASAANLQSAVTTWAEQYVGAGKPLYIYLMDHGLVENFCIDGCSGGQISATALDAALDTLEAGTGLDNTNVIMEACHSGSFMDKQSGASSISKLGRVIVTSTSATLNAYASADGAYFSDAFLTCIATSGSLKACFDQGKTAVLVTGVSQTPWLDDNGDGAYTGGDGSVANSRFVTQNFGGSPPQITSASVQIAGVDGTLTATVQTGGDPIELVWADIYAPSFQEPTGTTLNLGVPSVQLEPVSGAPGTYRVQYPGGFTETGAYRVVVYAQDTMGLLAMPALAQPGTLQTRTYLPLLRK